MKTTGNIVIEDTKLMFRNFRGKTDMYNPTGRRTFGVALDPDVAEALANDGWNIKTLKPRDEGDLPRPFLKVEIKFFDNRKDRPLPEWLREKRDYYQRLRELGKDIPEFDIEGREDLNPVIEMVSGDRTIELDEESMGCLDWEKFNVLYLEIRPFDWKNNGLSGRKAMLRKLVVERIM